MEISAIEINLLCKRISSTVRNYFLSSVYSMNDGILLRLNHSTEPERLVAISQYAPWVTTKNLSIPQASKFVSQIRSEVERCQLIRVEQIGNERIANFVFESRKRETRNLYAEFFSHGNLILTDADQQIIQVANPQTFRHRNLIQGEKYILPPSRGIPLSEVSEQRLLEIHEKSKAQAEKEKLTSIKWFGRNVGTTRKLVEEIFYRAKVNTESPAAILSQENLTSLSNAGVALISDLSESKTGHILIPSEESGEVDVCTIIPQSWIVIAEKGEATIKNYPSLNEALDEVQVESLIFGRRREASTKARAHMAELESALKKQQAQIELNQESAAELRKIASGCMNRSSPEVDAVTLETLQSLGIIEVDELANGKLKFKNEPRSYVSNLTHSSLASRLYDEAKRLESSNKKIREIKKELESQRDELLDLSKSQEDRAEKKIITDRRTREWFERYRWFFSSDGRLAVGGRDSTSNSIVINKYASKEDTVFHADLHGSPFFVLKGNNSSENRVSDEVAIELAQGTVSFSRAWKDELGSADAYWVLPAQIKKNAPTGEYLSRGSFFIEGKKNFIRHLKLELSVGVAFVRDLPRMDVGPQSEHKQENNQIIVVCGPDKSLANYCIARVKISPGKERGSEFARRLKQQLVNRVKLNEAKEATKRISIDDIIRILPSGNYKTVSEK